eukprot:763681-Hanusia_phi.AAC.9
MDMREARNVPGWIYDARSHPSLIFERSDLGQESSASNDSVQVSWEALSGGSDGTSQESPSQTLPMPASSHNHVERKGSPAPPAESALPVRSNILPRAVRYNGWDDGRKLVPSHQNTRQLGSVLPPEVKGLTLKIGFSRAGKLSREIKNISDELLASKLTPGPITCHRLDLHRTNKKLSGIPRQRSCEDFLGSFASRAAQRRPFRTHLKRVDSLLDDTWVDSAGCNEVDPQGCLGVDEACAVLGEMKKLLRLQNKALLQAHQELFALRLHKAHQDGETAQGGESVDDEWTKSLETTIGMIAQKVEALEAARDRKVGPRGQNKSSSRRKEQEGEDNERVEASQTSQSLELVAGRALGDLRALARVGERGLKLIDLGVNPGLAEGIRPDGGGGEGGENTPRGRALLSDVDSFSPPQDHALGGGEAKRSFSHVQDHGGSDRAVEEPQDVAGGEVDERSAVNSEDLIARDELVRELPLCLGYDDPLPPPGEQDGNRCRVLPEQPNAQLMPVSLPHGQAHLRSVRSLQLVVYRL